MLFKVNFTYPQANQECDRLMEVQNEISWCHDSQPVLKAKPCQYFTNLLSIERLSTQRVYLPPYLSVAEGTSH